MNKNLFLLGMAVAALTSCSENEVLDVAQGNPDYQPIAFQSFVNNSTRAVTDGSGVDLTKLKETGFYVYGGSQKSTTLFENEAVTWNATSNVWGYNATKYWMPGSAYKFAAFAPAAGDNLKVTWNWGSAESGNSDASLKFDATVHNTSQYDLVCDLSDLIFKETIISQPDPVEFTFGHLLTKIQIKLKKAEDLKETKIAISDVSFKSNDDTAPIRSKGSYTAVYEDANTLWQIDNTSEAVTFEKKGDIGTIDDTDDNSVVGYTFYMLPQDLSNKPLRIEFTATMSEKYTTDSGEAWQPVGDPTTFTVTSVNGSNYAKNSVYVYTATITKSNIEGGYPISFDVEKVDTWNPDIEAGSWEN